MRKVFIYLLLVIGSLSVNAQYRDVTLPEKPHQTEYKDYYNTESGFWCAFEAEGGSSIMATKKNMQYVGISFSGGYRINEFLRFGAGLGGRLGIRIISSGFQYLLMSEVILYLHTIVTVCRSGQLILAE